MMMTATQLIDRLMFNPAALMGLIEAAREEDTGPWSQNRWRPPAWDSTERRTLAEVLTQIPNYIIDKGDEGIGSCVSYVNGVVLFADLSGFTNLCEKYADADGVQSKVDSLTASLNDYLGRIVQDLMSAKGDILKYAGDAILSLWQSDPADFPATIEKVVSAAINIQCKMDNYMTEVGVNLRVKIGIAVGEVIFYHIANENERHFGEAGETIEEVNTAQNNAASGTVVVSPKAWALLEQKLFSYNLLDNGYVEINRRSSLSKALQTLMETKETKLNNGDGFMGPPEPESYRLTQLNKISPIEESIYRMYTNQNIINKLEACAELRWLSEIRTVTVMFLEVVITEQQDEHTKILSTIQSAFEIIYDQMTLMLGTINKLYMFDKGCTFLIIFGMPGKKHEDEPTRALKAADNIMKNFHQKDLEASIGVTTGKAFCGIIGHPQRHEYGVIGKKVNLAARLMTNYPKRIVCDDNTRSLSTLDPLDFHILPYIKMKGVPANTNCYEYRIDRRKDRLFSTFIPPQQIEDDRGHLIGREEEMKKFLEEMGKLNTPLTEEEMERLRSDPNTVKAIVVLIESPTGMGKTKLLQEMKNVAESKKMRVIFAAAGAVEHATPYFAIKALLVTMFRLLECSSAQERADVLIKFVEPHMVGEIYLLNDLLKISVPYTKKAKEKDRRKKLTDMICYLFEKATTDHKTMIILDDAQWIDKDSWVVLYDIIKRTRALLIISTRPFPAAHPPMDEARRILYGTFTNKMQLRGLTGEQMVTLACQLICVKRLPMQLINILKNRSHGVPLYAEQLVSTMLQFKVLQVTSDSKQKWTMGTKTAIPFGEAIPEEGTDHMSPPATKNKGDWTPGDGGTVFRSNSYQKISKDSSLGPTEHKIKSYTSIPEIQNSGEALVCNLTPGVDLSKIPIKDSVTGVILTRIDQLTPINQMVLKSASVLGRKFHKETLQAITPNIRESHLEKALRELEDAKIIEHCEEDRLSVAFFRNRKHDSLPIKADKPSYRFSHSILQETTYGILVADQRRVLHEGAAEHLHIRCHKCGECGCGKFLQNPLGPRNPSSGVAFVGASHGLSLLGRSQFEAFEPNLEEDEESCNSSQKTALLIQESLNSGSYDIMERGDDDDEKSKKVTIGKTTEIPYKFSRKNTLLGSMNNEEKAQIMKCSRQSLASVKLEKKYSLAQKDDVKKILLHHKNILSNSLVQEERELSEELSEPSSCPFSSDSDSGTGSAGNLDKNYLKQRSFSVNSDVFSSTDSSCHSGTSSSGTSSMYNGMEKTNMDQVEDWVLVRDTCHCRVVIRELIPTIVKHWKAAENWENLVAVMIEAVGAAVYMGDSEEALFWIGEIERMDNYELSRLQLATVQYLRGQAYFKNGQIQDSIDCYRSCLAMLGAHQPVTTVGAHFRLSMFVLKSFFKDKLLMKERSIEYDYDNAERLHIIVQCIGRLRVALGVQHKSVLSSSAAIEQFKYYTESVVKETSMQLETLANFVHACQKYTLDIPYAFYEKKLESIMDYNAMSPDNSMALFYAFLLLAETKFSEGNLTAGIEHGSNALLLADNMRHRLLFISACPGVSMGLLLRNDISTLSETLNNMKKFSHEISDCEGQAWFVAYALLLNSELQEQLDSFNMYMEFAITSVSNGDFTNDSVARYCMLISLALHFARQGNGTRASSWLIAVRGLCPPAVTSLVCAFFQTLLCETYILLYQLGFCSRRRVITTLKHCMKLSNVYTCVKPRVLQCFAFLKVLDRKNGAARTILARALNIAQVYQINLDIIKLKRCQNTWFRQKKTKNLLNRVLTDKKVHTLLEEEEVEGDDKVYTMPVIRLKAVSSTEEKKEKEEEGREMSRISEEGGSDLESDSSVYLISKTSTGKGCYLS